MSHSATTGKVVVAVDDSPAAMVAVDWAARDSALRNVGLTIVHVMREPVVTMWPQPPLLDDFWHWRNQQGRHIIAEARRVAGEAAGAPTIPVVHETFAGHPVPTLVELSEGAALLVVGRRGQGGRVRQLLGSVSAAMVRHGRCPVAVIHDEDPVMDYPAKAPVLVGVDGSAASDHATGIAFEEAAQRGVSLIAMHSWEPEGPYLAVSGDRDRREEGAKALSAQLAGWQEKFPDIQVEPRLVDGSPANCLLEASEQAQLTVVGSHGKGGFAGMLLGSVSSAVVEAARMPVIVAR